MCSWRLLADWEEGRIEFLGEALHRERGLSSSDRSLARELVLGVARHRSLYEHLSRQRIRHDDPDRRLLRALSIACHQLFALDRIPAQAVGHSTVELLKAQGVGRLAGVANAVVRQLCDLRCERRAGPGPLGRLRRDQHPADPTVRHSLPLALLRDLPDEYVGDDEMLARLNTMPHLCTRSRPQVTVCEDDAIVHREGAWTWWSDPAAAIEGPVARGQAVVQDYAQGAVQSISGARPGMRVLDLCAAPGGKSLAFVDAGCRVIAGDRQRSRLLDLRHAELPLLVLDACQPCLAPIFDIVILDVPCSNSGVLGRRPEAKWRYDEAHLANLVRRQRAMLAMAGQWCRRGGTILYATCSISERENGAVVRSLPGWRVAQEHLAWPGPYHGGGYVARLVESSDS